jgi:hypothetical protein
MLTTGALDIDTSKQLHSTFLDNIAAAQGDRALMVTSAERAWQTTVRGAESLSNAASPCTPRAPFHAY